MLGDRPAFETAVRNTIKWVSFDVNTKPQVFETTIRVLGGLLSGHQFASKEGQQFHLPWYKGELLDMAKDLGERLLPAFATPTGMPYARVLLSCWLVFVRELMNSSLISDTVLCEAKRLKRVSFVAVYGQQALKLPLQAPPEQAR